MEACSAAGPRTVASERTKTSSSLLEQPRHELRQAILHSDFRDLEPQTKVLGVDSKGTRVYQIDKGLAEITGDILHSKDDIKLKEEIKRSISSVKTAVDKNINAALPQNIKRKVTWHKKPALQLLTKPSFGGTETPIVDKFTKMVKEIKQAKPKPASQVLEHRRDILNSLSVPKIQRSVSFQQRCASSVKIKRAASTIPMAEKSDKVNPPVPVRKSIQRGHDNTSNRSSPSVQTMPKHKSNLSETRLKSNAKSQSSKKRPKSTERVEASDKEEKKYRSSAKLDTFYLSDLSQDKRQTRAARKRSKSRNKLKSSNSETKPPRESSKTTVQKVTSQKLQSPSQMKSPHVVPSSKTSNLSAKPSPQQGSSLQFLNSKSPRPTKRQSLIIKSQEPRAEVSTNTRPNVIPQDTTPRTKPSARTDLSHTERKSQTSQPQNSSIKQRRQQSHSKSPKPRCTSASRKQDTKQTSKPKNSKTTKSKSKLSSDANANNVNDIVISDKSPRTSKFIYSIAEGPTPNRMYMGVKERASIDHILPRSRPVGNAEKTIYTSTYSPDKRVFIDVPNLISNANFKTEAPLNNYSSSNNGDVLIPEFVNRGLYDTCFSELIESCFEEKWDTKEFDGQPKPFRQKVRFNLQNTTVNKSATQQKLQRALSDRDLRRLGRIMASDLTPKANSAETQQWQRKLSQSPAACLQLIPKTPQKWSNIWSAILSSKKWRLANPSLDSSDDNSDESDEEDAESYSGMSKTDVRHDQFEQDNSATYRHTWQDHLESPPVGRAGKKQKRLRRKRTSRPGESVLREIIFPPYTWSSENVGSLFETVPQPRYGQCGFVQSVMDDSSSSKNNYEATMPSSASNHQPGHRRSKMSLQMKWAHLNEIITKEVKKECMAKGYEFLQKLTRGSFRVHSLTFLANNKRNPVYTPVEVTAVRLPYAHFCCSVLTLDGPPTDRHYSHVWVTSLPPHPNLLMLLHRFCVPNWVFHVSEHCAWPSLNHLICKSSRGDLGDCECQGLEESACKTIFSQICAGVGHLHQHGVLHGDLTCSNVLVSNKLQVKLAGYGPMCQRMMNPLQTIKGHIQLQGDAYNISTPPEIMARGDLWTKSCDVWCMGIILLQMALGEIPHEINSAIRLSGCSKPFERFHLPACGYQLSRLVDRILQPCASNRPSVLSISNHPWLSDGPDMAAFYPKKSSTAGTRRTDGSTFPLPKRLQNREQCFQPGPDDAFENDDDDDKNGMPINSGQDYYPGWGDNSLYMFLQGPLAEIGDLHGNGLEGNSAFKPDYSTLTFPEVACQDSMCESVGLETAREREVQQSEEMKLREGSLVNEHEARQWEEIKSKEGSSAKGYEAGQWEEMKSKEGSSAKGYEARHWEEMKSKEGNSAKGYEAGQWEEMKSNQGISENAQSEKYTGCNLLKLMEDMTLCEEDVMNGEEDFNQLLMSNEFDHFYDSSVVVDFTEYLNG